MREDVMFWGRGPGAGGAGVPLTDLSILPQSHTFLCLTLPKPGGCRHSPGMVGARNTDKMAKQFNPWPTIDNKIQCNVNQLIELSTKLPRAIKKTKFTFKF